MYKVLVESPKERDHSEERGEDGISIVLREIDWACGVDSVGSGQGPIAGSCESDDERSGSGVTELVCR
jgi:hypothetical protein